MIDPNFHMTQCLILRRGLSFSQFFFYPIRLPSKAQKRILLPPEEATHTHKKEQPIDNEELGMTFCFFLTLSFKFV